MFTDLILDMIIKKSRSLSYFLLASYLITKQKVKICSSFNGPPRNKDRIIKLYLMNVNTKLLFNIINSLLPLLHINQIHNESLYIHKLRKLSPQIKFGLPFRRQKNE